MADERLLEAFAENAKVEWPRRRRRLRTRQRITGGERTEDCRQQSRRRRFFCGACPEAASSAKCEDRCKSNDISGAEQYITAGGVKSLRRLMKMADREAE